MKANKMDWVAEDIDSEKKVKVTASEREDLKARRLENQRKGEKLKSDIQDREERKKYADKIFVMLSCFLSIVLIMVILCAVQPIRFELKEPVLITLLSTSSANVIGIFVFVVKYLFNPRTKKDEPNK